MCIYVSKQTAGECVCHSGFVGFCGTPRVQLERLAPQRRTLVPPQEGEEQNTDETFRHVKYKTFALLSTSTFPSQVGPGMFFTID